MNIYVGNLSFTASEEDIRNAFSAYGAVSSVAIIMDQATGKSRGFGFVEMPTSAEGQAAIAALNGKDLMGRPLTVNEARPRTPGGGNRRPSDGGTGGYRR
jgi:cold-inducible RNA-binding protein